VSIQKLGVGKKKIEDTERRDFFRPELNDGQFPG
jgi:hypothetical protein